MADRSVKVTLSAQVAGYVAGMEQAANATRAAGSATEKLAQQQQAFETMGRAAMVSGGAMAAGLALSAKAAIDWDSAWAGVTKTVDGTPEQLAAVEAGLRGLTAVLPASHTEIAAVAEAAGQLGIATPNVVDFTRTMIDLGETTNLTANDAAMQLARFMTVMGTSQSAVSGLGSALVDLGNNYATTEAEIMAMGMRLAGAGAQIGMSEGQVLGLSTALSSVGIEAEAGGSAMSKVMIDMASSVEKGGTRLKLFADVAGMSADQFAAKWKKAPGDALASFVSGLANAESQGKSTFGVLEELGITEVRMRDALLRSASAADQFAAAMAQGDAAMESNSALADEAAKRYETTAAKLGIMRNQVVDAAISLGEHFLPAIEAGAESLSSFANMLQGLDGPMGAVVAWGGLIAAGILLTGGMALAAVPKIAAYKVALETLNVNTAALGGRLQGLGAFLTGPWGIAMVAAGLSINVLKNAMDEAKASAVDFEIGLKQGKNGLEVMREEANKGLNIKGIYDVSGSVANLGSVLEESAGYANSFTKALLQDFDDKAVIESLQSYGGELAKLAANDLPAATAEFSSFADAADLTREQLVLAINEMPLFKSALLDIANAEGLATDDSTLLQIALREVGPAAQKAADGADAGSEAIDGLENSAKATQEAISALADEIAGFGSATFDSREASRRLQAAYKDLADSLGKNGASFDISTEAGRANESALDAVAEAANRAAAAALENGEGQDVANAKLAEGRENLISILEPYYESRDAAAAYVDTLGLISPEKVTEIIANTEQATQKLMEIDANNPPDKLFQISADAADAYAGIDGVNVMPIDTKTAYVWGDNADAVKKIEDVNRADITRKTVAIDGNDSGFRNAWNSIMNLGAITKVVNFVRGTSVESANGNIIAYANGGVATGIYSGGPPIHKFAEPETGWEAYISGKPSERERNRQIWAETGDRLGLGDLLNAVTTKQQTQVTTELRFEGPFYGDPTHVADEITAKQRRANAAYGIGDIR